MFDTLKRQKVLHVSEPALGVIGVIDDLIGGVLVVAPKECLELDVSLCQGLSAVIAVSGGCAHTIAGCRG